MDDPDGIVWFVGGREILRDEAAEVRRPWLEESASWGSRDGDDLDDEDDKDGGDDGRPELLWI